MPFVSLFIGIFSKPPYNARPISGLVVGLIFTATYIIFFKFLYVDLNTSENWFMSISPEGIGFIGMILNFVVAIVVSSATKPPPQEVLDMVEMIRQPE